MSEAVIRPIAVCVFMFNGRILVAEGYDHVKHQPFYRPLGGGIEFRETSEQTIHREMAEELHAEVVDVCYLATLENIFTYQGEDMHEIVQVYDASFADRHFYQKPTIHGIESNGEPITVVWKALSDFKNNPNLPLYPTGLLELLLAKEDVKAE